MRIILFSGTDLTSGRTGWHQGAMNPWSPLFPSVPAAILVFGLGFELLRFAGLRSGLRRDNPRLSFTVWALRPWLFWAAFNLFYRWHWDLGFNNRRTFPFYANPWVRDESFSAALQRLAHAPGVLFWGLVAVALLALLLLLLAWALRGRPRRAGPALAGFFALATGLHLSIACLPNADWTTENGRHSSLLTSWNSIGSTMLHAVPQVRGSTDYFTRFLEIQPRLRQTIHALSHPPAASLSLYWIGKAMGVKGCDIRLPEVRLRYTLGLTAFGALNALVLFLLGRSLFDTRTGLLTAVLWITAPSVIAYATFAQDSLYAVFFNLALWLGWLTVTTERRAPLCGAALGVVFFAMTLLSYSWCLVTTLFALFALLVGRQRRWPLREHAVRLVLPLAIMTLLAAAFLVHHRLDYFAIYRYSSRFVNEWYPFTGPYQWIMALLGGQIDLWLLLGSVTASALAVSAARFRPARLADPRTLYLALLLGVFALPLLFGPNCLKMETARCWIWIASLPLAIAARHLLLMPSRLFLYGTPVVSVATAITLRLFLDFAT